MSSPCKPCNSGNSIDTDGGDILPVGASVPDVQPTSPTHNHEHHKHHHKCNCPEPQVKHISCSTIKDECHSCAEDPIPFARIETVTSFAMPSCDQTTEVSFKEDVSFLMKGLTLFGVDATQKTIRLKIAEIVPKTKLVLRNPCSSCCGSTKPVGETVIAGTLFAWGLPDCCAPSANVNGEDCLSGTFFFPAPGQASAANVQNANNFVLGGLYSMGGFIWKVTARVTSTQILLENPLPGNGSTVGGYLEGGCDGECLYPITPISEASECDDAGVSSVTLIGCTPSGKKKLVGPARCGFVQQNADGATVSLREFLGGSAITGPHYIQWDAANPCNSKLVSSPDLAGATCATITCALFLTPANVNQEYEVEVSSTQPFTSTAPNNVITLGGRQFTVLAIITAGIPGKIRVKPRFEVTVSETIPTNSQACVVLGCQPFPSTDYPYPCALDTYGERVFCAIDGLRTAPRSTSGLASLPIADETVIGGIKPVSTHDRAIISIAVANPSPCHPAVAQGHIEITQRSIFDDTGVWFYDILWDEDATPTSLRTSLRVQSQSGRRIIETPMFSTIQLFLNPGQTKTVNVLLRLRTTNASSDTDPLSWEFSKGLIAMHMTTL